MNTPMFTPLPEGQVSESIILPNHLMQLGIQHMDGAGLRIVVWDGVCLRHMAHMKARRWAGELEAGEYAETYAPVTEALRKLSQKVEDIEAEMAARKAADEPKHYRVVEAYPGALADMLQPPEKLHYSSCAVNNEPAFPAGECDCGGYVEVEGNA